MSVWSLFYQLTAQHIKFFRLPFHSIPTSLSKQRKKTGMYPMLVDKIVLQQIFATTDFTVIKFTLDF